MAVGGGEEDFRRQTAGSRDISCCRGRGSRRSGNVKVDEAPMKREEAMKGSWSSAVDERRPSLAVDDEVGVVAPARWKMGGGRRRLDAVRRLSCRRRCMNGKWRGGGISNFGRASLKCGKVTNLSPV